jgi:hypothetical protein
MRSVGDASHHVEPGRDAPHVNLPAVEKPREAGGITVRPGQQTLEFLDFEWQVFLLHGAGSFRS